MPAGGDLGTVGVEPSRSWTKGTVFRPGAAASQASKWIFKSPADIRNSEVSAQLDALKCLLPKNTSIFRRLPDGTDVILSCVVYAYRYWPGIHFTSDELRYLREIDAELDIDLYDQLGMRFIR